jgi:hypothetical protein
LNLKTGWAQNQHRITKGAPAMAKNYSVDELYRMGRTYPKGDGPKASEKANIAPRWETDPVNNSAKVRFPEDQRDAKYDNNVKKNWLRGYGKPHPQFKKGE